MAVISVGVVVAAAAGAVALRSSASRTPVVVLPLTTTAVTCGQHVTTSIVVGNDLFCSSGNGLTADASGIIINLNGHTVTGPGAVGSGVNAGGNFSSGVTVENGTVRGWAAGVDASGPSDKVVNVRATANTVGIQIEGSGSTASANLVFANSGNGIALLDTGNVHITSNIVRENGQQGIDIQSFRLGNVIQTNKVENNSSDGIRDQGARTTITGNISNGNGADGIKSAGDPTSSLGSNTANYNGAFGIEAAGGGSDLGSNVAKGNAQAAQCKDVICP